MKIAIPTNDEVKIASHLKRSTGFKVFIVKDRRIVHSEFRPTRFLHSGPKFRIHGSSKKGNIIHEGMYEAIKDCDRMLVNKISKHRQSTLVANNVYVDITREKEINKAVEVYLNKAED